MLETAFDPIALAAALVSALAFGVEGIFGKHGMEAGGDAILASLMAVVVSTVVFVTIAAANGFGGILGKPQGVAVFFASGVFGSGLGVLAVWQGVDRVGASVNAAVTNVRPVFAALLGVIALGEALGGVTIVGMVVLVAGLVLVALSKGGDVRGWRSVALVYPVLAAGAFAVGNVGRRFALTRTDVPLVDGIAINALGGLLVLTCFVVIGGHRGVVRAPRRAYGWFLLSGTSTTSALLFLFFALEREVVAVVDAISATAPVFTVGFTWLLLRDVERVTGRLVAGILLVVAGAVTIVSL